MLLLKLVIYDSAPDVAGLFGVPYLNLERLVSGLHSDPTELRGTKRARKTDPTQCLANQTLIQAEDEVLSRGLWISSHTRVSYPSRRGICLCPAYRIRTQLTSIYGLQIGHASPRLLIISNSASALSWKRFLSKKTTHSHTRDAADTQKKSKMLVQYRVRSI